MNTQDPSSAANATPVDEEGALKAFKAEFVKDGSYVLDAWLDRGFIQYQINPELLAENLGKMPFEYMGVPTVLTLFPRQEG
ncbi:hypothetical protein BH11CYA1_BH11CYA1_35740 [soil metagenome]